ncbi:ethanolamine utilization protein EutH [Desulfosporosinus nitroreducens]|uniref:ethanolamine utilization protein EutH n=1 Tax=Desulfosporosinus nitroreducens TaxID=2018668 RepID=UPI00207D0796|nr:ethanolamine utilization protein EutH [Desulfosporosinus nitroreducens]MCO1604366.1 ethanolamine utilization protein EutH [Desulfosporosinus nitroreducens]
MVIFGKLMISIIMACCLAGAVASAVKEDSELGQSFINGIETIGTIFLPIAGIMISIPYLTIFIEKVFGSIYSFIGADLAIAATTFIPSDIGGYVLAQALAQSPEAWIMSMVVGIMAAPTILYNIPIGLTMLEKEDHQYLALGMMSGMLAVPFGVFVTCMILFFSHIPVREAISTNADATYVLSFGLVSIFINLLPLIIICVLFALGLKLIPKKMIKGFMIYGKILMAALKLVVAFAIIEYFTGVFSTVLGGWGFDPFIADEEERFRALEITGIIGIMLAGAFPMVYLLKKYLQKPLTKIGTKLGLTYAGSAGLVAASANVLAMFATVKDMPPKDKVKCIAYSVCAGYLLGDYLSFTANFQPTLIVPVFIGQLCGGIMGIFIADKLSVPQAIRIAEEHERKTNKENGKEYCEGL